MINKLIASKTWQNGFCFILLVSVSLLYSFLFFSLQSHLKFTYPKSSLPQTHGASTPLVLLSVFFFLFTTELLQREHRLLQLVYFGCRLCRYIDMCSLWPQTNFQLPNPVVLFSLSYCLPSFRHLAPLIVFFIKFFPPITFTVINLPRSPQ